MLRNFTYATIATMFRAQVQGHSDKDDAAEKAAECLPHVCEVLWEAHCVAPLVQSINAWKCNLNNYNCANNKSDDNHHHQVSSKA